MKTPDVSVVIICMNNLRNLYPCLESIRQQTREVSYETLVVAYLFSAENLAKVKADFPWATFIESNELRGFSENNNLALRVAKGRYCFVLNDDTKMEMPVLDRLVRQMDKMPERVAVLSPVTTFPDGRVQVCGRPKATWRTLILGRFHLRNEHRGPYVDKEGLFQTYNLLGAAFLIRRDIFEQVGWFDEIYYFAPEDLALSTLLNRQGWECWVDADVRLIHYEGMTSGHTLSMVRTATAPAGQRGCLLFYEEGKWWRTALVRPTLFVGGCLQLIYHAFKAFLRPRPNSDYVLFLCDVNCLRELFSRKTPKEIFVKYYTRLKK